MAQQYRAGDYRPHAGDRYNGFYNPGYYDYRNRNHGIPNHYGKYNYNNGVNLYGGFPQNDYRRPRYSYSGNPPEEPPPVPFKTFFTPYSSNGKKNPVPELRDDTPPPPRK